MKSISVYLSASIAILIILSSLPISLHAQGVITPFEEWNTQEGTQNFFYKSFTTTDGSNNIYITGATLNGYGNYDIITAKYNSSGVQQWIATYAGAGNGDDLGARLTVDGSGNVFVVGTYYKDATDSNNCVLLKYNSSGTQLWIATYDGGLGRSDGGANLKVDASTGDIYVCGTTYSNSTDQYDFLILKYNSSGTQQWVQQWDNVNLWDGAYKITVASGLVTVSGGSQINTGLYDFASVQYTTTGVFSTSRLNGGSNSVGFNTITGMVLDASNNIYITGSIVNSNYDCYTMKLDVNLNQLWTVTYNGSNNMDDEAHDIQVDALGNVYICGYTTTTSNGKNYLVIKYNSSGIQQWVNTFDGKDNADDIAYALILDGSNNIYITGNSQTVGNDDYMTIKYDNSGTQKWKINYNSWDNAPDKATDICIDNSGDLIVTGQTQIPGAHHYTTVKYIQESIITPPDPVAINDSYYYTENRGQVLYDDNSEAYEVKYYNTRNTPGIYITDYSINYITSSIDQDTSTTDSIQRVELTFNSMNSDKIRGFDERNDHNNFYLGYTDGWRERVPNVNRLYYSELWNNIDLHCTSNANGFKYYFLVKPSGSTSSISLHYTGANSISVNGSGDLVVATNYGNIVQPKATIFQVDGSGNYSSISWQPTYSVSSSNVTFTNIGTYDSTKVLVFAIDMGTSSQTTSSIGNLDWSTYYGGNGIDEAYAIKNDVNGNIYVGGYTWQSSFPISTGAYQAANAGDYDGFYVKFNSSRQRLWATYYGGTQADEVRSLFSDGTSVYGTGYTQSSDFPTQNLTGTYYDGTYNGAADVYIVKLSSSVGALNWGTFYGGSGTSTTGIGDRCFSIVPISGGGYYLAGLTNEPTNFPNLSSGTAYYQSTYGGGASDMFVAKFNSSNARTWSTFIGGSGYDYAMSGGVASDGSLYVTGWGTSGNFPFQDPGGTSYYQNTSAGAEDIYMLKFSSAGVLTWATFFGGDDTDQSSEHDGLCITPSGDIVITGSTLSSSNFPVLNAGGYSYYQNANAGGEDAFMAIFQSDGTLKDATYLGGLGGDAGEAVTTDGSGNIFLTGRSSSGTDFPVTNLTGAYNQTYSGSSSPYGDGFLACFPASLSLSWCTFIGGSSFNNFAGSDFIRSISINASQLYLTGSTSSDTPVFPVTDPGNNAYYQSALAGGGNAFISEFNLSTVNVVGVNELNDLSFGTIYPNPAINEIEVSIAIPESGMISARILNVLGQEIRCYQIVKTEAVATFNLNIENLASGTYLIQINLGSKSTSKKLIKY